jgi:hypothetical protein
VTDIQHSCRAVSTDFAPSESNGQLAGTTSGRFDAARAESVIVADRAEDFNDRSDVAFPDPE